MSPDAGEIGYHSQKTKLVHNCASAVTINVAADAIQQAANGNLRNSVPRHKASSPRCRGSSIRPMTATSTQQTKVTSSYPSRKLN